MTSPPEVHPDWYPPMIGGSLEPVPEGEWLRKNVEWLRATKMFVEQGEGLGNYLSSVLRDVIETRDKYSDATKILYTVLSIGGVAVAVITQFAMDLHIAQRILVGIGLLLLLSLAFAFIDAVMQKIQGAYQLYAAASIHAALCHAAAGFPVTHDWFSSTITASKRKGIWYHADRWTLIGPSVIQMPPKGAAPRERPWYGPLNPLHSHLRSLTKWYRPTSGGSEAERIPHSGPYLGVATHIAADCLESELKRHWLDEEGRDHVRAFLDERHHGSLQERGDLKIERFAARSSSEVLAVWESHPNTILIAYGDVAKRLRIFVAIGTGICVAMVVLGKDPSNKGEPALRSGGVEPAATQKLPNGAARMADGDTPSAR